MLEDEHRLSLGMLMHVKCIHDLCILLDHILSYLIVLYGLRHVSIDSWDFLNDPLSFGFSTAKQIFLFLHVFEFQGPSRCQTDTIFLPHHFLGNRRTGKEAVNRECHEAQKGAYRMAKKLACMVGPTFWLVGPLVANFGSTDTS
jgi:hypothetical protein